MPTRRQHRLNELLFEELSLLVPGRLDDPRLEGVRVTRVETTQDLSTAKIYVVPATDDEAAAAAMLPALEHAQGRIRVELGDLGLRRLPRLVFARDKQFEHGERVLALLAQMHGTEDDAATSEAGDDADDGPDDDDIDDVDDADGDGGRSDRAGDG
jgi:ribosome-binding factor A